MHTQIHKSKLIIGSDISEQAASYHYLSTALRTTQLELYKQIKDAFSKPPSLSGVIEGRRPIKLGKRGGGRGSYFPSKKNALNGLPAVSLPVESRIESMYALELERNPRVKAFRTQALEVKLPGLKSPVFPDFLILDQDDNYHVREIKADKRYLDIEAKQRIERIADTLNVAGISYGVIDAAEMPTGMKSENLFFLHKQFNCIPHHDEVDEFLRLNLPKNTYSELSRTCRNAGLPDRVVPYLLFIEKLCTDWKYKITGDSEVWL